MMEQPLIGSQPMCVCCWRCWKRPTRSSTSRRRGRGCASPPNRMKTVTTFLNAAGEPEHEHDPQPDSQPDPDHTSTPKCYVKGELAIYVGVAGPHPNKCEFRVNTTTMHRTTLCCSQLRAQRNQQPPCTSSSSDFVFLPSRSWCLHQLHHNATTVSAKHNDSDKP